MNKDKKYFASKEAKDLINECNKTIDSYYNSSQIYQVWRRNNYLYHQNVASEPLEFTGARGEMISLSIPKARKLVRDYLAIVTKQKLKFKAVMKDHKYTSWSDSKIADAISEHLVNTQHLDNKRDKLGEHVFVLGQSFLWCTWDSEKGNEIQNPITGEMEKAGGVSIKIKSPTDVFYKHDVGNQWDDVQWCVVSDKTNKYDLASLHPEHAEYLESYNQISDNTYNSIDSFYSNIKNATDETITVYHFYHKPTPALPQGRMVIYVDDSCVLYDGPNVYESLPVFACIPETIDDLVLGYPQFSNLTAVQEMLDHNYSVIASNQSVYGLQSMLNPKGSDIGVRQLFGVNFIDYTPQNVDGGGKPEPLQYPSTPSEIFNMVDRYSSAIDNLGGINAALRGQTPQGITAASAIATLTANALEFISSFSRSLHETVTNCTSFATKLYFMFGAEEQFIQVVESGVSINKKYNRDMLNSFDKYNIEITNPLLNSYSFNLNSAESLLAKGIITDPKTYFRVLEGDRTSILYDDDLQEEMLIQQENDDLIDNVPCSVIFYDNDDLHIMHHKSLLMNPNIRRNMNPETLQLILDHIQQHEQQKMQKNGGMQQLSPSNIPNSPEQGALPPPENPPESAQPAQPAQPPVSL